MTDNLNLDGMDMTPSLTLEPDLENGITNDVAVPEAEKPKPVEEVRLSPAEQKMVAEFSQKIDLTNSNLILRYGAASQQKIANFSDTALQNVRTKDLGEVGDMLTNLISDLRDFKVEEQPKGIMGFFKKKSDQIAELKTKYDKADVNVEKVCTVLEEHQRQLMKDIALLDKLYEINLANFKELSMYILAGKKKLEETRQNELPVLIAKAKETNLPQDSQAVNDLVSMCDRFEKKIHDLELTRMISIQMAPQIRMVQNNDTLMTEKIQSTIVNTIPLWKSQMVLALGLAHSQRAMEAQRTVTDLTNELLRKNADTLKMGTVEVAKESERSIVDIETLKHTNETLISTLDEVMQIQNEGRQKRIEAEAELRQIENDLKQKMLEMSNPQPKNSMGQQ